MGQLQRIFPTPFALAALLVAVVVGFVVYRRAVRHRPRPESRWRAVLLATATWGLLLTIVLTLVDVTGGATTSGVLDTSLRSPSAAQTTVNLLLLWWLALTVSLLRPVGVVATALLVMASSVLVEVLQWVLPTGRSTAVMDVLLNTVGGVGMAVVVVHVVRPLLARATGVEFPLPSLTGRGRGDEATISAGSTTPGGSSHALRRRGAA